MKRYSGRMLRLDALTLLLLVMTVTVGHAQPQADQKISAPGQYSGYTSPDYKRWTSTSQYVAMRDGVRLQTDVYVPKGAAPGSVPASARSSTAGTSPSTSPKARPT